jgi:hypothetical protein
MSNSIENLLNQLGLIENNAVFFRDSKDGTVYNGFSSEMQKKIDIIKPDAYFIFNNQPFILFFDLSQCGNSERENEIHKQVWSFDHAPIIFILKKSEVQIFNAFSYSKKNKRLEEIKLTDEERNEKFSFWNLQSGATWKNWYQEQYLEIRRGKIRKRANQQLFENIKQVREALTSTRNENKLSDDEANTLILRLIFVRYLIDRGVSIDENYIKGKTTLEKRSNFCQLIENPQRLNNLFDKLNEKFNGVLFKNFDITLTEIQSKNLAHVFNGEMPEEGSLFYGTDSYFEVFDFSIIPVEVISGIYESLIDVETRKLNSAVYTPSFLVEYILNDTVDKFLRDNNTADCKIFDPSVGSGVFLVQSLRKMIDKEIELNGKLDKLQFSKRIREIAKNNLFGIDINPQALKVTCFSIYIALLDYQEPKEIDVYKFPNLIDENLFHSDFFDEENLFNDIIKQQEIDFILGNPPWKSNKDDAHINWLKKHKKVTGGFEIAQSFLLRSKDFMQIQTQSALIVTSTIFYNVSKTTRQFKNEFLTTFCIDNFFDLSPVRKLIFEEKNSPASIVYYRLSKDNEHLNNIVKHQSVKSNRFLKHYKMLVIEKYDQKEILQRHFIENDWMFKVALYGNTLDFHLLKRINLQNKNVSLFAKSKGISYGDGIKSNKGDDNAIHLIGLPVAENNEIKRYFTNTSDKRKLLASDVFYESGRNPKLFKGSHILIKAQAREESEIIVSFVNNSIAFKCDIFGFATVENNEDLKLLYSLFLSDFYTYYQFLISSLGIASRAKIRLQEHLSFPFIEPNEKKKTELVDLVNEFLLPFKEHYKEFALGEPVRDELVFDKINDSINELYGVKAYEKDLIDYVLDVSRYQFQESKQNKFTKPIHTDIPFLEKYVNVYVDEFSKIYPDEYLQVEVYPLEHFIAMNFVFHKVKPKSDKTIVFPDKKDEKAILKRLANNLSISQITNAEDSSKNLYIQKDIKGFEENSFYIIKPNELKCWHRAMAWYDVAEFKDVIENAELNQLKGDSDGF